MSAPVFATIDVIQGCRSIDQAWRAIRDFAGGQGLTRIGCCYGPLRPDTEMRKPFVRGTFSERIGKRWSKDELFRRDPIVKRALASPVPFLWGTEFFDTAKLDPPKLEPDVRAFYEALRDDGARSLLVVPMRCDPQRGVGIGILGNDMPRAQFEALISDRGAAITLAVLHADLRMVVLARNLRSAEYKLAKREAECLELLTSGNKNEVIAQKMGITVHTVQLHLSSAKRKLGAATREQALAKALMYGVIPKPTTSSFGAKPPHSRR